MYNLPHFKQSMCWFKSICIACIPVFFLLARPVAYGQTTYYIANTGSDQNAGTSPGTPFQSLTKINSLPLQPGDSVLFRRGDSFPGTLTIQRSGSAGQAIVVDAYGNGPKPILAGSVPVTNWSYKGGNVWQADCPSCGEVVTGLYRDGVSLPLGRYPNLNESDKGQLTTRSHVGNYQLINSAYSAGGVNWQGAEVVLRPTAWILDRAFVQRQSNDTLTLQYNSNYSLQDNELYFFQNHPATLDQPGEWCYNSTSKTLSVYDPQGTLSNHLLTATVYGRGIDITSNVSYVNVRNLKIKETLHTSIYGYNVSNIVLSNLDIINAGEDGIRILGSGSNLLLENNSMRVVNNNGIEIDPYQTVTIRENLIRNVGTSPGRGKSGDGQYNGLTSNANLNVLIEDNVIDSIGYNGITFWNNTTIRHNIISNYCYSKIDGGGLYCHNGLKEPMTNIHIISNIIYTNPAGSTAWYDYAIGIFLDDCVEQVEIRNNTIFGNTQWGVFLHGANTITLTDNTLFDNRTCQLTLYHNGGFCPIRNDIIKRNIFVSKLASQTTGQFESNADDLIQYGTIDSNYYARPFKQADLILGIKNAYQGGYHTLVGWQNFSGGQDLHSKGSPITYLQYKNDGAGGTNRLTSTFDTGTDGWELAYSNYNNATAVQDNTNKLDGGSLRVSFTTPSGQSNSYAQAIKPFGTITAGKTYVLRFDAVSSVPVNLLVYLRSYGPPYTEYDKRYTVSLDTTRKSYELLFTATATGNDAIIMVQIDGEGPTFWLDNVRLQEDVPVRNNPDDFIKLYYNPTLKDSVITLSGLYRDVKNQPYSQSVTLQPFTSIVLFRDTLPVPPADLSLSLQSDKRVLRINEAVELQLRISNQSDTPAALARWTYRLPANLELVSDNGQVYTDNVLTGTVSQLAPLTDTTFVFRVKPTAAGVFRTAAQITTATSPDPDSRPNSGTADGEDDAATVELRVEGPGMRLFESPNPTQRALPPVLSNQPVPDPAQADLSLRLTVDHLTAAVGQVITYTVYVTNAGGGTANVAQVENQLPNGLEPVNLGSWTANGRTLSTTLTTILPNTTVRASFQVRVALPGFWLNQAQIKSSSIADPDSTPGNGFSNGEDDQAQVGIRSQ